MKGQTELLRRLVGNRMMYGLFHPLTGSLPIAMVSVALTDRFPASITELLAAAKGPLMGQTDPTREAPRYAIFYSISLCNTGSPFYPRGVASGTPTIMFVCCRALGNADGEFADCQRPG